MFKKTITFEDFNGEKVSKDFYFHMSKAELLAMAADGDVMVERIKRIIASKDGAAIIKEFRELIEDSVGMRSEDGERFIKDPVAVSNLVDSPAFDELLMELCTDAKASAEFVRQLVPEKMQKEMQEALKNQTVIKPEDELILRKDGSVPDPFGEKEDTRPLYQRENREPTNAELLKMSRDEISAAFRWRQSRNQ